MFDPSYGLTKTLDTDYETALERVTAALKTQGFGVLTEIDVKATMKAKLDKDFRKYKILGACNPPIAHEALSRDPGIGLLLPCNVIVFENDEGKVVVSFARPKALFQIIDNPDVAAMAEQVEELIRKACDAV
ncbi:MAG: DUF302 domain-containing protein [Deltaproteobacteria bacterium]|nr:DUF302 domain-containing protein [Deltaproteobacteria bacterium]MCB9490206.1 DUF302 domain-containing protein [Deltaproteobacteria bacterium]